MKRILLSALAIMLAIGLMGSSFAYFSDIETSEGNTFTAGIMDLSAPDNDVIIIPNASPGYTSGLHTIFVEMNTDTTIEPDHVEIDVDTYDFVDWMGESGGINTAADFTKQIEVLTLWWYDDASNNLLAMVDDNADGNPGFISLYDVEAYGVFDDLHALGMTGSGRLKVELSMPLDLPDADDDKYQGDSIKIMFEFGIAQAPGQDVLTN